MMKKGSKTIVIVGQGLGIAAGKAAAAFAASLAANVQLIDIENVNKSFREQMKKIEGVTSKEANLKVIEHLQEEAKALEPFTKPKNRQ